MVTITTAISMVIKHLSLDQILIKLLSSILFMVISTLETIMDIRHKNIDYKESRTVNWGDKVIQSIGIIIQGLHI